MRPSADTYAAIVLHEPLGPVRWRVSRAAVRQFALAVGEAPPEGEFAQPTLLGLRLNAVILAGYGSLSPTGFQAKERFTLHRPPRVGEEVLIAGRFVDKYRTNGIGYVVLERTACGVDGELIMEATQTAVREYPVARLEAREQSRAVPPASTVVPRSSIPALLRLETPIGTRLGPVYHLVRPEQVQAFGGTTEAPSAHDSPAAAQELGLATTSIQGWLSIALLSQLLTAAFGDGWVFGGQMDVTFIAPAYVDQLLSVSARITTHDSGGSIFGLAVRIEGLSGRLLVKGTALAQA